MRISGIMRVMEYGSTLQINHWILIGLGSVCILFLPRDLCYLVCYWEYPKGPPGSHRKRVLKTIFWIKCSCTLFEAIPENLSVNLSTCDVRQQTTASLQIWPLSREAVMTLSDIWYFDLSAEQSTHSGLIENKLIGFSGLKSRCTITHRHRS